MERLYFIHTKRAKNKNSCGQRHIPDVEGRVGSIDMCLFIHAIAPRHVETVCLLSKLSEAKHHISVQVDMEE